MTVTLLSHTPLPEHQVAAAARLCYSSATIEQLQEKQTDESVADFVQKLAEMGHESPIEHITFTFGIEGVSRSLMAQITRHRMASFSVQSQRYVTEGNFEYVIPPSIAESGEATQVYLEAMEQAQQAYNKLNELLAAQHQQQLEYKGRASKENLRTAKKSALEDARFVLPNACTTKMMCTMNARSLLNFFSLRCCNRAQWEIRALAEQMLRLVHGVAPHIFAKAGPGCLRGDCPEGAMTCGQQAEMRAKYLWL